MSTITVAIPSLMVVKDNQGQAVGLVPTTTPTPASPLIGTTESAWEGIAYVSQKDALGTYRVPSAYRNKITGAIVPNPMLRRPIQNVVDAFPEDFKPKPKQRPKRAGGAKGANGGGGAPIQFAGGAPQRIEQLNTGLMIGMPLTQPSGELTVETQAALVAGLDLDEFTPALIAYLDPANSVNFLIYEDGLGGRYYIDAQLETPASLSAANSARITMDFEAAYFEIEAGKIIARQAWVDESGAITKMLKRTEQGWFVGTEGAWVIVTSARGEDPGNLAIGDLEAVDWFVVG